MPDLVRFAQVRLLDPYRHLRPKFAYFGSLDMYVRREGRQLLPDFVVREALRGLKHRQCLIWPRSLRPEVFKLPDLHYRL